MTPCFFVKSAKRSDRQKKLCYNGFKDIGLCYWKNLIKIKRLFLIPILIQVGWMAAQSCACHFFSKLVMQEFVRLFNPEIMRHVENATAKFPVYKIKYNGSEIVVYQSPVGAPTCVSCFEEVIQMGIKKILLVGCCGCLDEKIDDYSIIVPTAAIRDEGTSYPYCA